MELTPLEETFADVEKLLYLVVHDFRRRRGPGLDIDKLKSDVFWSFMVAYEKYEIEKGSFSGYIRFHACKHLLTKARRVMQERNRESEPLNIDPVWIPQRQRSWQWDAEVFRSLLSEDVDTVVQLTLDVPRGLKRCINRRGGTPRNWRASLRQYLMGQDWEPYRITKAFNEIGDTLQWINSIT